MLSDHYDRVTVFERDDLPEWPANRTAVQQGMHLHLLMGRGAVEFESLFPGILSDMVSAGVPIMKNRPDCISFGAAGHLLGIPARVGDEFILYVPSRPHLEWQIRRRTLAVPNIELVRCGVAELLWAHVDERVTGVLADNGNEPTAVSADLVVDATGRGTRLPVWLEQWGFGRPPEETVDVGIGYATHHLHIPEGQLSEMIVVAGATREKPVGLGMLLNEDGNWRVTTFGTGKVQPPQNFAEICELADHILPTHISAALRKGEPLGEMVFYKYPKSKWRRYDKMDHFPTGIIPFGDAVASFNPTFGQGMTMAAIQASNLRSVLESGDADIERRLSRATAKATRPVWTMTAVADFSMHNATGDARWWYKPVGALFDQFLGAAETDPVLAEWFLRRSLLDTQRIVPSPRLVGRAIRHNMALMLTAKLESRRSVRDRDPVPSR